MTYNQNMILKNDYKMEMKKERTKDEKHQNPWYCAHTPGIDTMTEESAIQWFKLSVIASIR